MDEFQRNILSHIQSSSSLNPQICPACGKHFATESGANKHLTQSHKCAWYNKNKFEDLPVYPDTEDYNEDLPNNEDETLPPDLDEMQVNSNTVKPPYNKHAQKQVLLLLYKVKLVRK